MGDTESKNANNGEGYAFCLEQGMSAPEDTIRWMVLLGTTWEEQPALNVLKLSSSNAAYLDDPFSASFAANSDPLMGGVSYTANSDPLMGTTNFQGYADFDAASDDFTAQAAQSIARNRRVASDVAGPPIRPGASAWAGSPAPGDKESDNMSVTEAAIREKQARIDQMFAMMQQKNARPSTTSGQGNSRGSPAASRGRPASAAATSPENR